MANRIPHTIYEPLQKSWRNSLHSRAVPQLRLYCFQDKEGSDIRHKTRSRQEVCFHMVEKKSVLRIEHIQKPW